MCFRIHMNDVIMICDNWGKERARIRHITKSYGKGDNLLVIENVSVITCPHCGESFLEAETLHEVEHIRRQRKKLAKERNVATAGSFPFTLKCWTEISGSLIFRISISVHSWASIFHFRPEWLFRRTIIRYKKRVGEFRDFYEGAIPWF